MCPISRYSSHRSRLEGEEEEEGRGGKVSFVVMERVMK